MYIATIARHLRQRPVFFSGLRLRPRTFPHSLHRLGL